MSERLDGKVAVVTGAGRGLGRALAVTLGTAGARVVVAARTASELDTFVADAKAEGREALGVPTDITDAAAVASLVARTIESFGRVDILVNNSGVLDSSPLLDLEPEDWDRVIETNLRGVYLATRAVGRHLVKQGSGKIINIASNFAYMGIANHAAYSTSKAAVVAFTKCMAVEWARHNVQVNALAPGYFATDLNSELRADESATERVLRAVPARRMGAAEELGPWVLLLAGRASDFMTGEAVVIDGGQAAR
jgi:NAD(P)-dependent dehydrogenase (short-subunit alcohol dehydrogenase family)